jgi:DNA-binding MarR family transcriptional regulator
MATRIVHGQDAVKAPKHSPAGAALTGLLVEVIRLSELFTQTGEALARPAGQTLARWLVLETLDDSPRPVADVARRLRLARQSVQRVMDLLEADGLVAYAPNPRHRRAKLARLTPAGRRTLRAIQRAQREWADRNGTEIGAPELDAAATGLRRIRAALASAGPASTRRPKEVR